MWWSWYNYEQVISISTQNISNLLLHDISDTIGKADAALQNIEDEIEEQLASDELKIGILNKNINREANHIPEVYGFWISNAQGILICGTELKSDTINISQREYFQKVKNNPAVGMYVSEPVLSRVTNQMMVNIVRRIEYPNGIFGGVVFGSFTVEYLTRLFKEIHIGEKGTIALRDSSLREITRYPPSPKGNSTIGQISTMKELIEQIRAGKASATIKGRASIDNVDRIYTFRKVKNLPLYVLVGRATDDYFSAWFNESLVVTALLLIFPMMSFAFTRSTLHQWKSEKEVKAELFSLNQDLEKRILERTEALNCSNEQLQKELSERIIAERAHRQSELKYRQIVDTANEGIVSLDEESRISFVNHQIANMLGYTIEEMLGQKFEIFLAEDQLNDNVVEMKKRAEGIDSVYERDFRKKDGTIHWMMVSAKAIIDNNGKYTGSLAMLTDINDFKEMGKALRDSEERHRLLFETAQEGIVVIQENRLSYFNPMLEKITGYTSEELLSLELEIFVYPDDLNLVLDNYEKRLQGIEAEQRYQFRLVRKDGTLSWVELSAVRLEWNGSPATLNFINDINMQKLTEIELVKLNEELQVSKDLLEDNLFQENKLVEELTDTKEKLEKINSEKDKFFSIIAHDLKSPFQGLIGYSELLSTDYDDLTDEEIKSFIFSIAELSNSSYKLLENLLQWSRMQTGQMAFTPEYFNLQSELHPTLSLIKQTALNKKIEFDCVIDNSIFIKADKNMLSTIVRNLVSNSIKFTNFGGKITLTTGMDDKFIEVKVSDSGIGIDKEGIDKLFKIDKNKSRKGTANEEGTGLGLLLCKELVEKHGGRIWVESEVGRGTTFFFTIRQ